MPFSHDFDEIIDDQNEILHRLNQEDLWRLNDILLFVFGYEYKEVFWDIIFEGSNAFPIRQYGAVLEAFNNPKENITYVEKKEHSGGEPTYYVRKGTFFNWARKKWFSEPRVQQMYSFYQKYKSSQGNTSLSNQSLKAKIKNHGDKLQIEDFKKHLENDKPDTFKANISDVAKRVMKDMKKIAPDTKLSTFRRYTERMTLSELIKNVG